MSKIDEIEARLNAVSSNNDVEFIKNAYADIRYLLDVIKSGRKKDSEEEPAKVEQFKSGRIYDLFSGEDITEQVLASYSQSAAEQKDRFVKPLEQWLDAIKKMDACPTMGAMVFQYDDEVVTFTLPQNADKVYIERLLRHAAQSVSDMYEIERTLQNDDSNDIG